MRCKICNIKFEVKYFNQKSCLNAECILTYSKEVKSKEWAKTKKVKKDALKTTKDYVRELQIIFNKFIRLRDKDLPCISCGKIKGSEQAGHYRSAGSCPELRFNEGNVHGQCIRCNMHLHGNLIEYRIGLVERFGSEFVDRIELNYEPKHYNIEELKELKVIYRDKIKKL